MLKNDDEYPEEVGRPCDRSQSALLTLTLRFEGVSGRVKLVLVLVGGQLEVSDPGGAARFTTAWFSVYASVGFSVDDSVRGLVAVNDWQSAAVDHARVPALKQCD